MDINKRIMELENEIAILPQGSINIKKINVITLDKVKQ